MKIPRDFICVVLFAFSFTVAFSPSIAFCGPKELIMAVGSAIPPYNIPETDSGIEMDILRESLKPKGYTIKPKYVPFARRNKELRNRRVDGALTITSNSGIDAYYSDEHLVCNNVVISLKRNKFEIEDVLDLKDKGVAAFQDATVYLGEAYAAMAKENPKYREIANQEIQVNLLYRGRVDAIVLDKNIFYYHKKINDMVDTTQPIEIWHIFEPTPFRVAFIDKKVRDDFNEGLRHLRSSGRYEEIVRKYLGTGKKE